MTRHPNLLQQKETALVIIDIQERIHKVMAEPARVIDNTAKLIRGCKVLGVPLYYTEQYPKGLGPTVEPLRVLLGEQPPIIKSRFSVCCETELVQPLQDLRIKQILLAGIEAHVCCLQSALDFQNMGFQVHLAADATSSRQAFHYDWALQRMQQNGVTLTNAESALFELLEVSGTDQFKQISAIIK